MKQLILTFLSNYKYKLIVGFILIASLLLNVFAFKSCSNYRDLNNNNLIALSDSIHYYKTKTGELVANKRLLEGDLKTLKIVNDSLYTVVRKDMNVKNPSSVVYVETSIINQPKDTVWSTDTVLENVNITKDFAFNNEYRSLEGNVFVADSTLGLHITKDQTNVDYILAIEDNTVKIKSSNPYVKFNEIQGITIPKPKHKTWGFSVGPAVFGGTDINGKFTYGAGVSIVYGYRIK